MLETRNGAENKSVCLIPVSKRLFYQKECSYIYLSLSFLFTQTLSYTSEKVHGRLPGGISLRFHSLHCRDIHNVSIFIFFLLQRIRCPAKTRPLQIQHKTSFPGNRARILIQLFCFLLHFKNHTSASCRPKKIFHDPSNLLLKIQPNSPPSIKCQNTRRIISQVESHFMGLHH